MSNSHIDTKTIIIYWKQGHWKSLLSVALSVDYLHRLYGNITISQNEKIATNLISKIENFDELEFSPIEWLMLIDEVWLNFNANEHQSAKNKALSKHFFLIRKYNLSSIFIAQRWKSVPTNLRELADIFIFCEKIRQWNKPPLFKISIQELDDDWEKLYTVTSRIIDLIWLLQKMKISYNTLEPAIIS